MIKLGSASNGENGPVGGAIGDQTGKEIRIQQWYDYPWTHYLEYPDQAIAEKAATYMEQICNDSNYGYDQSQRLTGYYAIKAIGGKVLGAKGEFDCSSLVSSCYNLAGVNVSPNNSTFSIVQAFLNAGFKVYTDADHVHSDKLARRGGIYLNETHHVVMALEDGPGIAKKPEVPKKKTWIEILKTSGLDKSDEWEKAIKNNSYGDLLKYLPQLIEKVYNSKG